MTAMQKGPRFASADAGLRRAGLQDRKLTPGAPFQDGGFGRRPSALGGVRK